MKWVQNSRWREQHVKEIRHKKSMLCHLKCMYLPVCFLYYQKYFLSGKGILCFHVSWWECKCLLLIERWGNGFIGDASKPASLTEKDWVLAFASFRDINIPTMVDFKLPIQNGRWKVTHLIDSLKPEKARSSTPLDKLESQNIRAKRKLKRFKMDLSYIWGN